MRCCAGATFLRAKIIALVTVLRNSHREVVVARSATTRDFGRATFPPQAVFLGGGGRFFQIAISEFCITWFSGVDYWWIYRTFFASSGPPPGALPGGPPRAPVGGTEPLINALGS